MTAVNAVAGSVWLVAAGVAITFFFLGIGAALLLLLGGAVRQALHLSGLVIGVSAVAVASLGVMFGASSHGQLNEGVALSVCVALLGLVGWAFFRAYKLFVRP